MIAMHWMWIVIGLALGIMHAAALWGSAQQRNGWLAISGIGRLLLVAIVLTLSAMWGGILPTFIGWMFGFFAGIPFVLRWSPK